MLRTIALLSIVARCAAFGTVSGAPGGACIDAPAHLIAEETAKMGEEYAQITSCDAIAEAGGCVVPDAKVACCATCALPQRESRANRNECLDTGGAQQGCEKYKWSRRRKKLCKKCCFFCWWCRRHCSPGGLD